MSFNFLDHMQIKASDLEYHLLNFSSEIIWRGISPIGNAVYRNNYLCFMEWDDANKVAPIVDIGAISETTS